MHRLRATLLAASLAVLPSCQLIGDQGSSEPQPPSAVEVSGARPGPASTPPAVRVGGAAVSPSVALPAASAASPAASASGAASAGVAAAGVAAAGVAAAGVAAAGVAASGASAAGAAPGAAAPRLGAIGRQAHVYAGPNRQSKIGILRPGTSVALRAAKPIANGTCKTGRAYEIEPLGCVCEDDNITLDLSGDLYRALAAVAPDRDAVLPYNYGLSTGSPMYGQLPTAEEAKRAERRYRAPAKIKRPEHPTGHEELTAEVSPPAPAPLPFYLADHRAAPRMAYEREGLVRKEIREGNMLSFRGTTRDEAGRLFLLATNLTAVPADRVWLYRTSEFQGVELKDDHAAPLGWVRRQPRPRFRRKKSGAFAEITGETFAARTPVYLTGSVIEQGGQSYQETREPGVFARLADLSLVAADSELPKTVAEGERWIDVSLSQGTLTVFSGTKAVYSTLMSPGAGGTTQSAALSIEELLAGAFTPLGVFRVSFKYREAIMTPEDRPDPEKAWIDDVPYIQYFRPPYAIHTTYWHEDFGMPKSGGCINVSPKDARYLFGQTEPRVPDDWEGAAGNLVDKPSTPISIRK